MLLRSLRSPSLGLTSLSRQFWSGIKEGPPDPILGISIAFQKDPAELKLNLGVGAYRDDNGKPFVLSAVKEAEKRNLSANFDHEYAPITGLPKFNKLSRELLFGSESLPVKEGRIVTAQTLSGTGALRVAATFLERFLPKGTPVYLPTPTWANHGAVFSDAGMKTASFRYYNPKNCGLDFEGMIEDIRAAPEGAVVLLHACAHNPTGVDPTPEQWKELSKVMQEKNQLALFDSAYQGFASGNLERDRIPIEIFTEDGHTIVACQSFAKNFGLYGERIGAVHIVCNNEDEVKAVDSQMKIVVRPMYSNPPVNGARIVTTILEDEALTAQWKSEVKLMADRIIGMRSALVKGLADAGSTRDWSHITNQIGMFCFSGLTPEQVDTLAQKYHIYMTRNGRISMAGVTSKNVGYLADCIHQVTKE